MDYQRGELVEEGQKKFRTAYEALRIYILRMVDAMMFSADWLSFAYPHIRSSSLKLTGDI
jgi:hypothetical protein